MAKQLQLRRGTTSQHSTFTGANGEVTIDTDKKVVVVHDGATAGGIPLAKQATVDTKVVKVTSTDNAVVRFDGVTGQVQNSGVVIDDNNNVGFGVTPSVSTGTAKVIEIGSVGNLLRASVNDMFLTENAYFNGGWKYGTTGASAMYELSQNTHSWFIAPNGTVGNTIPWTNAMTLDSAGNLTVGNTGTNNGQISAIVPVLSKNMIHCAYNTTNALTVLAPGGGVTSLNYAQDCIVYIGKATNTNRSINAIGTINASGADYAEYEYNNDINIAKGQIVGFKEDGTLTDKYSESIRFAIKSTNPSIVGGDVWGCEEIIGKRPEQPIKTEEMSDEEFAKLEEQYEQDLANFEDRLEVERQKVDRIAYAGKVPVNVYGAVAGQYVIAVEKDGGIDGKLVNKSDMTFSEYQDAVGRVNKILDDGRAEVAVIIH